MSDILKSLRDTSDWGDLCDNCEGCRVLRREAATEIERLRLLIRCETIQPPSDVTDDCTTELAVELAQAKAESERLTHELEFTADECEKQDEEIERLRADLGIASACVADYVAQRDEARDAATQCYRTQRDEARDAATQCYRRFRGTITGRAILKRWPWLERKGEET